MAESVEDYIKRALSKALDERMRDHGGPNKVLIEGCKCEVCEAAWSIVSPRPVQEVTRP